jgi:hypothetical protein
MLMTGALAALMSLPAAAQESRVKGWDGLQGRETAVFRAKVVDVLCELSGDCAEKCGEGRRQMGLVREDDGKLILAAKNQEAGFQGAAADLYPFCGQTVAVDGLMVGNPDLTATRVFQVHFIQREGSDKWLPTKRWTRIWQRRNPEAAAGKGPWFRNDPAVNAEIEANGYLGLGAEADATFIQENY